MAKERYITARDIESIIDSTTLNMLIGGTRQTPRDKGAEGDYSIIGSVIPAALETVRGYIRHWYDSSKETRDSYIYNAQQAYKAGDRIWGGLEYYLTISDAAAGTPLSDTAYFELRDDRNPKLVEICCVIAAYALFRRVNPRVIPEQRQHDLDSAMKMLRDIQQGRLQLDIAERVDVAASDAGQAVSWGVFDGVVNEVY